MSCATGHPMSSAPDPAKENQKMLKVLQAFDPAPIAEIETDDAAALERKLKAADSAFKARDGWLKPHQQCEEALHE